MWTEKVEQPILSNEKMFKIRCFGSKKSKLSSVNPLFKVFSDRKVWILFWLFLVRNGNKLIETVLIAMFYLFYHNWSIALGEMKSKLFSTRISIIKTFSEKFGFSRKWTTFRRGQRSCSFAIRKMLLLGLFDIVIFLLYEKLI